MAHNKSWTRDGLILGLDPYDRLVSSQYHGPDPKRADLSQFLAAPAYDGGYSDENDCSL